MQIKEPASGNENWPRLVVGHVECEQSFPKCWLLALWVLDGNTEKQWAVQAFPHGEASAILFTTEGQLRCYDHHYYFIVTADFALGKLEKKVSCIEISSPLDFAKSLHPEDAILA